MTKLALGVFYIVFMLLPPPDAAAEPLDGKLLEILFDINHDSPDSISDMPSITDIERPLSSALTVLAAGDFSAAATEAKAAGYWLQVVREKGTRYSLLRPTRNRGIDATIVIDHNPLRELIIEAPHPVKDRATGEQAAVLFKALGARALIIAGANRCASRTETPCSGQTRTCDGDRGPYRNSDTAHAINNTFHLAHSVLSDTWPRSVIIQPHGFGNPNSEVWFVLSDGSTRSVKKDTSIVGRLRESIRATLGRRDRVISCQDEADKDIDTRRLCATTNVQGRRLNGSADICNRKTENSSGRFIHIEQVYHEVRRPYDRDWARLREHAGSYAILEALTRIVPCVAGVECADLSSVRIPGAKKKVRKKDF